MKIYIMKSLIVVFIALMALGSHAAKIAGNLNARESSAKDLIEALKPQMAYGWPKLNVPPLAPFSLSSRTFNLESENISAQIDNLILNGLDNYEVIRYRVNPITSRVTFDILFENVNSSSDYQANVTNVINLQRAGNAFLAIENVSVTGYLKYGLGLISNNFRIKELKVYVNVGNVVSDIENLSSYQIINRKLNDIIAEWIQITINEGSDYIAEYINDQAVPILNDLIGDRSYKDIIDIINGGGGSGSGGRGSSRHSLHTTVNN